MHVFGIHKFAMYVFQRENLSIFSLKCDRSSIEPERRFNLRSIHFLLNGDIYWGKFIKAEASSICTTSSIRTTDRTF